MARSLDERLARLRSRRMDAQNTILGSQGFGEAYEKRTSNKATRYALGAMQEVDPRSTQISLEEAEKVERNLTDGLKAENLYPDFRLQGSVPLNVHIRGASDVDLLVIEGVYVRIEACQGSLKSYSPYLGRGTLVDDVLYLRSKSENVLERRFWGATVDKTPAKSIQLSDGGFRRKVDVVPANWLDTSGYQQTLDEAKRGVQIVNKYTREHISNYPFVYIAEIKSKALQTNEGARMGIRLAKNIKNDAEADIGLSSYDIGSLIYHCPNEYIMHQIARDLMVLSGVEQWFDELSRDYTRASSFMTPDGTRRILDGKAKWDGLVKLSSELTELARSVERELASPYDYMPVDRETLRKRLKENSIPLAPDLVGGGYRF
ncbi:hypothetical protein [Cereibacter sphaeroides]|uniref:hypothetical protein n=1 Tax=Cereibacter sphaeroides TaxID=1063 RepID=UPI003FCEBC34